MHKSFLDFLKQKRLVEFTADKTNSGTQNCLMYIRGADGLDVCVLESWSTSEVCAALKAQNKILDYSIDSQGVNIKLADETLHFCETSLTEMHTDKKRAWYIDTPEFYLDVEIENKIISVFAFDRANNSEVYFSNRPVAWMLDDLGMVTTSEEEMQRWVSNGRKVTSLEPVDSTKTRLLSALMNLADPALVNKGGGEHGQTFSKSTRLN